MGRWTRWTCGVAALLGVSTGVPDLPTTLKMKYSNPVLPVMIEGHEKNLILTTDIDGIVLCTDRPDDSSFASDMGFDYSRKLLRYQLQGLVHGFVVAHLEIPSLKYSTQMPIMFFDLQQQWLSPAALRAVFDASNAHGFIGVGYAYRVPFSPLWSRLLMSTTRYRYNAEATWQEKNNKTAHMAKVAHEGDNTTEWDWSEPCASVDQIEDDASNNQGLTFPIQHASFSCQSDESSANATETRRVDMFGEYTSNWDVVIDFNAPCLMLPEEFYDSLAGWTGLEFNDELRLSEIDDISQLPTLSFSLGHDGPVHQLPLQDLILQNYSGTSTSSDSSAWVCIERSTSIIHAGSSLFSAVEGDVTATQRYRLQGSMSLRVSNMYYSPIVFGQMVLFSLGDMLVDGTNKQVAFRKPVNLTSTRALPICSQQTDCVGAQVYSSSRNACQDPDCSRYYFQSLDEETRQCVVDPDWLVFLTTTVAVFAAAEWGLAFKMKSLLQRQVQQSDG
ncbi:hypothetical protein Poli38472_000315 [Pythium oligandrum]|uniref:Uncharacterized protein n=1 Tax=Pythium oligandrum TaxID=41045 RepID=A0A8K1CC37_PYTOL|nr:hypothetical protein Poli38472_000315 [Pythium oligandrum]|eukprot:TMW60273.1 hypothetical protein Poli38472_000315 [Pythium oligandrum]